MVQRHSPPTRKSTSHFASAIPLGPHQRTRCAGSAHSLNRSSGDASKLRLIERTSSSIRCSILLLSAIGLPLGQLSQIRVHAIELALPELSVAPDPTVELLERTGLD